MSKYRYKTSPEFEVDFKRLCKNFELIERLKKRPGGKIDEMARNKKDFSGSMGFN